MLQLNLPEQLFQQVLEKAVADAAARWIANLPQPEPVRFYSIPELCQITGHCRNTVVGWIEKGKKDARGNVVRLKAHEFTAGHYRVELNDLRTFGLMWQMELKPLLSHRRSKAA